MVDVGDTTKLACPFHGSILGKGGSNLLNIFYSNETSTLTVGGKNDLEDNTEGVLAILFYPSFP